ncbi:MAG: hypothetical protein AB2747_05450 [Candidatus Thiodiazotropha taylori]
MYNPPSGNAVALDFTGSYSPPGGNAVALNLGTGTITLPVQTGMEAGVRIPWNDAPPKYIHRSARWNDSRHIPRHIRMNLGQFNQPQKHYRGPWNQVPKLDEHTQIPWGELQHRNRSTNAGWEGLLIQDEHYTQPWDDFFDIDRGWRADWIVPPAQDEHVRVLWDDSIGPRDDSTRAGWDALRLLDEHTMTQWGDQIYQEICYGDYEPEQPVILNHETALQNSTTDFNISRYTGDPRCTTRHPGGWRDVYPSFEIPDSAISNPILRTYIVINTISVLKLPERTAVAVSDLQLSLDIDSWAWTITAKVLGQNSIDLIKPTGAGATEIEVTINGYIWVFIVERYTRDSRFKQDTYQVTGRSKTAYLADPYKIPASYVETQTRTAQQLAEQSVTPDGWTVNWNTVVWSVPPGAYYYNDKTPIQTVNMIAQSVGAVILPHRALDEITINPRYQDSVWNWGGATPSASLTLDVVKRVASKWHPKPDINGVYVSGESQGVSCFVRRQGTNGANLATEVVDTLITHQDAGRERGRNIICDQGYQEVVDLELPLMPAGNQPELFEPGALIEINEGGGDVWRGLVLGSRINATDFRGGLKVTQTLSVEKHL